ncbi:MAG: hypothetical protein R2795_15525 [Saprospiraceae bacterium]
MVVAPLSAKPKRPGYPLLPASLRYTDTATIPGAGIPEPPTVSSNLPTTRGDQMMYSSAKTN